MNERETYDKLMARALRLLALRPRSREELRQKLLEKNPTQGHVVGQVLARLEDLGYLNDAQLATDYVLQRVELKPVGRRRVKHELQKRKLSEELIDQTLDDVYTRDTEDAVLDRAIHNWVRRRGQPRTRAELKKLFDYLLRLGFEPAHAREKIEALSPATLEVEKETNG